MKRNAIKDYFYEQCSGCPKTKDFWPTVKPFLSKNGHFGEDICLLENDNVISDTQEICDIINDFFSPQSQMKSGEIFTTMS